MNKYKPFKLGDLVYIHRGCFRGSIGKIYSFETHFIAVDTVEGLLCAWLEEIMHYTRGQELCPG